MPLLFVVGQHQALEAAQRQLQPGEILFAYSDNIYMTCTFQGPGASNITKIPRKDPKRERRTNFAAGGGKTKSEILGPPPFGASTLRGPPFEGPTLCRPTIQHPKTGRNRNWPKHPPSSCLGVHQSPGCLVHPGKQIHLAERLISGRGLVLRPSPHTTRLEIFRLSIRCSGAFCHPSTWEVRIPWFQSTPSWMWPSWRIGEGNPSNCRTNSIATAGCRARVIGKQSDQLTQNAATFIRQALRNPRPPKDTTWPLLARSIRTEKDRCATMLTSTATSLHRGSWQNSPPPRVAPPSTGTLPELMHNATTKATQIGHLKLSECGPTTLVACVQHSANDSPRNLDVPRASPMSSTLVLLGGDLTLSTPLWWGPLFEQFSPKHCTPPASNLPDSRPLFFPRGSRSMRGLTTPPERGRTRLRLCRDWLLCETPAAPPDRASAANHAATLQARTRVDGEDVLRATLDGHA